NGVMFKPFGIDDLVRKIDGLLGRANGSRLPASAIPPGASASAPAAAPKAPSPTAAAPGSRDDARDGGALKQRLASLAGTPGVRVVSRRGLRRHRPRAGAGPAGGDDARI